MEIKLIIKILCNKYEEEKQILSLFELCEKIIFKYFNINDIMKNNSKLKISSSLLIYLNYKFQKIKEINNKFNKKLTFQDMKLLISNEKELDKITKINTNKMISFLYRIIDKEIVFYKF